VGKNVGSAVPEYVPSFWSAEINSSWLCLVLLLFCLGHAIAFACLFKYFTKIASFLNHSPLFYHILGVSKQKRALPVRGFERSEKTMTDSQSQLLCPRRPQGQTEKVNKVNKENTN
jgi:hypothetical protein